MYQSNHKNERDKELETTVPLFELRQFVYDLLRRTFLKEPDVLFIKDLQVPGLIEAMPFISESEDMTEGAREITQFLMGFNVEDENSLGRLHWDYTRLFVGPHEVPTPPWESAYLNEERLLFQKETLEVRRVYLKYALIPKEFKHEADDHLGLELDFMYQLCLLGLERIEKKNFTGVRQIAKDQQLFLQEHLLQWVPQLCDDIVQNADTPFYRGIAKILKGYLMVDLQATQDLLEVLKTDMAPAI